MSGQEIIFKNILEKFKKFPIPEDESTFLELCHYSGERFEEICSRILEFYFQPNNKHGFRNLWFKSLCQLIGCDCDDAFEMETRTEENTYGAEENNKRIDIILETPSLIIAIENKIGAGLYNQLDVYREHIEKAYHKPKKQLVVLTAHVFSNQERNKANQNGFVVIGYDELFKTVRSMIGDYVSNGSQKYLVFMLDFMKTVENRANIMTQTDLDKFFVSYRADVEELIKQFNNWKRMHVDQQIKSILKIYNQISSPDSPWWIYQDLDLGTSFNDNTPYRIGIESNFNEINNDPLGEFHIRITTWKLQCWDPYEKDIFKRYPEGKKEIKGNRVNYYMPVIENSDERYFDTILEQLKKYHQSLKELAEKVVMDAVR